MKRISAFLLVIIVFVGIFSVSAYAEAKISNISTCVVISEQTEVFKDGCSVVITVREKIQSAEDAAYLSNTMKSGIRTKSGSKMYSLRDQNSNVILEFTVNGTFEVNPGVSSVCTAASYSINIINSSWHNTSASAYASGNQAIGEAEFCKKILFVVTQEESCTVTLTCDKNGNLS